MNNRIVYLGVAGGVIAAAVLAAPLYLSLPSLYTAEWTSVGPALSAVWGGLVVAILVITGYSAARWSWTTSISSATRWGAIAGLLASLVAYMLIGVSASGVAGVGLILQRGIAPVAVENQGMPLLTESVVRVLWYTYLSLWGSALVGVVLGALGGVFATRKTWGSQPTASNQLLTHMLAMFTVVASSLNLVLSGTLTSSLAERAQVAALEQGITPSLPTAGVSAWPLSSVVLVFLASIWWNWKIIGTRWIDSATINQSNTRGAATLTVVVSIVTIMLLFLVVPNALAQPLILGATLGIIALTAFGIRGVFGTPTVADASPNPMPRRSDWLHYGALLWLMISLQLLIGLPAVFVSLMYGIIDFISVLTQPSATPDVLLSVPNAINNIFRVHLMLPLAALIVPAVIVPFTWLYCSLRLRARRPKLAPSH